MKIAKMGRAEIFFIALIVLTSVMWLRDRLPASREAIAGVRTLAAANERAQRVVAASLAENPAPSNRDARRLRERVAAIEASAARPVANTASQRLMFERARLAALSFVDMTDGDRLRWLLLGIGRYSEAIIGVLLGLGALAVTRKLRIGKAARYSHRP
jgi:hypothetical protein